MAETTQFRANRELQLGERVMARILKSAPRPVGATTARSENLLALLYELRHGDSLTCRDLSRRTDLASPTVHRLLASLLENRLIIEDSAPKVTGGLGRPANSYRFNRSVVSVAGVDIGAETTRIAIAGADGTIIAYRSLPTAQVVLDLPTKIGLIIDALMSSVSNEAGPLVGVGVGIPGSLDPTTGVVKRAFIHQELVGLPIKTILEERLLCSVVVEKDDHLSVVAEVSDRGTAPDATSLVVVNYGRGVGIGVVAEGVVIKGVHGQAGRIVRWPSRVPGVTLGEVLPVEALLAEYRASDGNHSPVDGAGLCELVRAGDPVAREVIEKAGMELAGVFLHLATIFDPQYMVLGGGFSGSFDLFDQPLREALSVLAYPPEVLPTAMGSSAVVVGGLLAADQFIEMWLRTNVAD